MTAGLILVKTQHHSRANVWPAACSHNIWDYIQPSQNPGERYLKKAGGFRYHHELENPKNWVVSNGKRKDTRARTHTQVADLPMRAWNKLLWKMSMTLWMETRSSRSSVHCSLDRYSSSSTRARCASGKQRGETMNHITSSKWETLNSSLLITSSSASLRWSAYLEVRLGGCEFNGQSAEDLLRALPSSIMGWLGHRLLNVAPVCDVTQRSAWQDSQVWDALATASVLTLKKDSRLPPPPVVSVALQHYRLLSSKPGHAVVFLLFFQIDLLNTSMCLRVAYKVLKVTKSLDLKPSEWLTLTHPPTPPPT